MATSGGGRIVNISSRGAFRGEPDAPAYGASKAAVNHLSTVLAQELGPQGIRVNTVSPGHTYSGDTDINADPSLFTDGQKNIADTTALRRLGTAQDVADAVSFLASEKSGYITGQCLAVAGGMTM